MSEDLGAREAVTVCEEAWHDGTGTCGKDGQPENADKLSHSQYILQIC